MLALHVLVTSLLLDHICALETRSSTAVNATILGDSKVSMAWYAGWHSSKFTLSDVSWSKYTHLAYAFAVTTPDVTRLSLEASDEELLPRFNVKATLSIGGWTGSRHFSTNVGSAQNRTKFVKTVVDVVQKYSLDGLDFDWEYPNRQGVGVCLQLLLIRPGLMPPFGVACLQGDPDFFFSDSKTVVTSWWEFSA
ncbi:hypothetical protein MPER_08406 [Moniliophthora perniciosa FA553]|nr:hypothetical protein MPER_08406 [Moniliophthora perniciosa FA553]